MKLQDAALLAASWSYSETQSNPVFYKNSLTLSRWFRQVQTTKFTRKHHLSPSQQEKKKTFTFLNVWGVNSLPKQINKEWLTMLSVLFRSVLSPQASPQNKSMKDLRKKAKPDSITRSPQTATRLRDRLRLDVCVDVYVSIFITGWVCVCVAGHYWASFEESSFPDGQLWP